MLTRQFWSLLVVCACALVFGSEADGVVVRPLASCRDRPTQPACGADVSVTVTPPSGIVYVGEDVAFTVTVANAGPRTTPCRRGSR